MEIGLVAKDDWTQKTEQKGKNTEEIETST